MKICKDGRIWGQSNKEAGDHLGILTGHKPYIKKIRVKRFCIIEGCNEKHFAKGLCVKHYNKPYSRQYQKENKDYYSEYMKQYVKTPAGKASKKATRHNRRTLKKDLTKEIVQRVYEGNILKYGTLTCILCGKPVEFADSSLEHLTPLSRGGSNLYENLGVAHWICNVRKGAKTMVEWFT